MYTVRCKVALCTIEELKMLNNKNQIRACRGNKLHLNGFCTTVVADSYVRKLKRSFSGLGDETDIKAELSFVLNIISLMWFPIYVVAHYFPRNTTWK